MLSEIRLQDGIVLPNSAELSAKIQQMVVRTAERFRTRMVTRHFRPFESGKNTGDVLQIRSGQARRSIRVSVVKGAAEVYTTSHYLPLQEFGGTIVPKAKRYMTVPLPAALTAGGSLKGGARLVRDGVSKTGKPVWKTADGQRTRLIRSKRGNLIILREVQTGRKKIKSTWQPIYVLKLRVVIPPRFGWRAEVAETNLYARAEFAKLVGQAIQP